MPSNHSRYKLAVDEVVHPLPIGLVWPCKALRSVRPWCRQAELLARYNCGAALPQLPQHALHQALQNLQVPLPCRASVREGMPPSCRLRLCLGATGGPAANPIPALPTEGLARLAAAATAGKAQHAACMCGGSSCQQARKGSSKQAHLNEGGQGLVALKLDDLQCMRD